MNIEELFENELYHNYGMLTTDDANLLINYLKTEVMEYVAELDQRIAELELRLGCCRDASTGKDLLIAELEAQLPKVVRPEKETDYPLSYWCDCDGEVFSGDVACRQCGAKLDWRTS